MTYFILFNILPIEIVYIIYIINKKNYANDIIKKFTNKIIYRHYSFKNLFISINYLINYDSINLFTEENYKFIKFMEKNIFRKSRNYWLHFLNLLSVKLNLIRNHLHLNGLNKNDNKNYYFYKLFYKHWFLICRKYNIKIEILKKTNFRHNKYIHIQTTSNRINKLKSLNNAYRFPLVLDDDYNVIDENISFNYLIRNY